MSLLSTFPEIDKFFKKNQFSDIELSDFLTDIEKNISKCCLTKSRFKSYKSRDSKI